MRVKNFLFHRVNDESDELWPAMKPQLFEKIIKKLSRQYKVLSIEDIVNSSKLVHQKVTKPLATILFDDGYKDNIDYAAPILKKYNCPASFYIVTDCIDRNVPTWTYIVDFVFQNTIKKVVTFDFAYVPDTLKEVKMDKGNPVIKKFKPWMKTLPNSNRLQIMKNILEQCDEVIIPKNQMMSWQEVRQLNDSGFAVGSHTNTHPMLGQLENSREIQEELQISYLKIKNELGIAPQTISYPIGSYDERVIELSKKVGYNIGLAVEQRFYQPDKDDRFSIPRVELYQEPWYKVNARMNGLYTTIKRIWK